MNISAAIETPKCREGAICILNKYCDRKWNKEIAKKITEVKFSKGQNIFHEGLPVFGAYFIQTGKVVIFNTGKNWAKQILHFATEGEMIGLAGYMSKVYMVGSQAIDDSVLCFIKIEDFRDLVRKDNLMAMQLIGLFNNELQHYEIRQKHLSQLRTDVRVAEALLMIMKSFGKLNTYGIVLDIPVSRSIIAETAGTSIENTSRILRKLIGNKVIRKDKRKILIRKPEKLFEMLLDSCCDEAVKKKCLPHLI